MPEIPKEINKVVIEFAQNVDREITTEMLSALKHSISSDVSDNHKLKKIWISSASEDIEAHKCPSRHFTGNGVDLSRINGKKMSTHYDEDDAVTEITNALQQKFESAKKRRENFGPHFKKKLGKPYKISGHKDHIHWSVNGDHSICSGKRRFPSSLTHDVPEVCSI